MGTNFPFASIGAMPVMAFWVRAADHLPTLSPNDVQAALGTPPAQLSEEQRQRIQLACAEAQMRLFQAVAGTPYCGKPS